MNYELQPSGLNPEWEANKEQNIAIAKRIEKLLLAKPSVAVEFEGWLKEARKDMEEMQNVEDIKAIDEYLETGEYRRVFRWSDLAGGPLPVGDLPEGYGVVDMGRWRDMLTIDELTIGHDMCFTHVDNRYRRVFLGVGYSEETRETDIGSGCIDLLPEGFNFPVYMITGGTNNIHDDSREFDVSTIHGKLPNDFVGADGLCYRIRDSYYFNFRGEGLKITDITEMGSLEENFDEEKIKIAEQRFRVGIVPREGHSIASLTPEDYAKINKMFQDIDAGVYQYKE